MAICDLSDRFEEVFHAERVLMVGSNERRLEEDSMIKGIGVDIFEELHNASILLLLGTCQEEYVALHTMYKHSRNDLYFRIGVESSLQILLTIVFAGVHLYEKEGTTTVSFCSLRKS